MSAMARTHLRWPLLMAGIFLLCTASVSVPAGTIHLSAAGPSTSLLNVLTNEPVIFIADDAGPYAVVSYNWAAGTIYLPHQGSTGTVILAFSGLYNYEDGQGHYGMIYVNLPPTCRITNPTNNAVFTAPASFNFNVTATDTDQDQLIGVDFWLNTNYLGGILRHQQPFTKPVTDLGPGTYTLTAFAVDYGYAVVSNSVTIFVQAPVPITLGAPAVVAGNFRFNAIGITSGKSIVLQSSTNVIPPINWSSLKTNVAGGSTIAFTNPVITGTRFFRIVQLP
jgi:hypothetical protein